MRPAGHGVCGTDRVVYDTKAVGNSDAYVSVPVVFQFGDCDGGTAEASPVDSAENLSPQLDPWALPEIAQEVQKPWKELGHVERTKRIAGYAFKALALIVLLYIFICSLDLLSSAFRLLGGRAAGEVFRDSKLLHNPMCGLMLGVLATVLLQSSSTSTSILVSMVASGIIPVAAAIPIVMGANIGTSMTNTLVSVAHSGNRAEFRRAFAGATVHDMFNWLTVLILLPIEVFTGYLYHLTGAIVHSLRLTTGREPPKMLAVLTEPLTELVVELDKSVIRDIATGKVKGDAEQHTSLVRRNCDKTLAVYDANLSNETSTQNMSAIGFTPCHHLFANSELGDSVIGIILLVVSLCALIACLLLIVKTLHALLKGSVASAIHRTMNADLPGRWSFLSGYIALLVGAVMTVLLQSSSVFTSALTPLVGIGILSIERMYPLTLGSNVGTTFTSVLAALASPPDKLPSSLQLAFCHLFFNITGILLFYPVPFMRKGPIGLAKLLGNKTARYRWFAVLYVVLMFCLLPAAVFGLSVAGGEVLMGVGAPILALLLFVIIVNLLQAKCPRWLPSCLRTWERLPKWMHSLQPMDDVITKILERMRAVCPQGAYGWCCCDQPSTTSRPLTKATESRKELLASSRISSRSTSPKSLRRTLGNAETLPLTREGTLQSITCN